MHVSSQSWPKRMITRRSSSARMAWSTAHPECRCGSRYDILLLSADGCSSSSSPECRAAYPRGESIREKERPCNPPADLEVDEVAAAGRRRQGIKANFSPQRQPTLPSPKDFRPSQPLAKKTVYLLFQLPLSIDLYCTQPYIHSLRLSAAVSSRFHPLRLTAAGARILSQTDILRDIFSRTSYSGVPYLLPYLPKP